MGNAGFEALCRSVIESLEAVTLETEKVYGAMGASFPVMVKELATFGRQESQNLLALLTQTILDEVQKQEAASEVAQKKTQINLSRLEAQIASLATLRLFVDDIREDSILMELLSLNALVIASKAGESGRAFSVITTELQQIASRSKDLTDEISRREANLDRIFGEFGGEWKKSESSERLLLSEFIASIRAVFRELKSGEARLLEGNERIQAKAIVVKEPLVRIMVEVQNQDRIRQSIDHVTLSIQELRGHSQDLSLEKRLDDLTYLALLPDLSVQVLDEISDQIGENRKSFQNSLDEAARLMEGLEQERRDFLDAHVKKGSSHGLEANFSEGERLFTNYFGETSHLLRTREDLVRKGTQLQKNISEMVNTLRDFESLSASFRNVDLASRIQVARHHQLVAMRDNASSMTNLTNKIEHDVGQTMKMASEFAKAILPLFEDFRAQFNERFQEIETFVTLGRKSVADVKVAQDQLIRSVEGTQLFTDKFTDQFSSTHRDLGNLDSLLQTIATQRATLGSLKALVLEEKRKLMAEKGVSEWKLETEKLKAIVNGFTIFTHKKFLADLGAFEVEQAADAGEVTLF